MEKWLCWGSLGSSALLLIMFILDLAIGFPFKQVDMTIDVIGLLACGLVGYLSFEALRELR